LYAIEENLHDIEEVWANVCGHFVNRRPSWIWRKSRWPTTVFHFRASKDTPCKMLCLYHQV